MTDPAAPPERAPRAGCQTSPARSTLLVLAVAIALVLGGLVLGAGDSPIRSGEDVPVTDAEDAARRQAAASGPTTTMVAEEEAPVFGAPVGASLLMGSRRGGWRYLDLDTGVVQDVPFLEGTDPRSIVSVRGGVVLLHPVTGELPELVSLPDGSRSDLVVALHRTRPATAVGLLPGPDPDHVWVLWAPVGTGSRFAVLATTDGATASGELDVPATPLLATVSGPVFGVGGRTYLSAPEGARLLTDGTPHAASPTEVAVLTCDDQARCAPAIVDVASGTTRPGPAMPGASESSPWMSLAPDGRLATIPTSVGSDQWTGFGYGPPSITVSVTGRTGATASVEVLSLRSAPVWLPGDLGLVAVTGYGVTRIFGSGDTLATERIPSVGPQRDDSIFVVPHGHATVGRKPETRLPKA